MRPDTTHEKLNAYRIMWLFVFFDLPTTTKKERKAYAKFRKDIQGYGFRMLQFSVYIRHCASPETADVHERRVRKIVPSKGQVSILRITDKQYGAIINYWGKSLEPLPGTPQQLELF